MMRARAVVALLVAVCASAHASAALMSETFTFVLPSAAFAPDGSYSDELLIQSFDAERGFELERVELSLRGDLASTTQIQNNEDNLDAFYLSNSAWAVTVQRPGQDPLFTESTSVTRSGLISRGESINLSATRTLLADTEITDAALLETFEGTSSTLLVIPLTATFTSMLTLSPPGLDVETTSVNASISTEVSITYFFVPEPSSVMLLLVGCVCVAARSRQRTA